MTVDPFQSNNFQLFKAAAGPVILELLENKNKDIEEIMRNPDRRLFIYQKGKGEVEIDYLQSDMQALQMLQVVASENNQSVKTTSPRLKGVIPGYKYRFQGFLPDVVKSPSWNIRIPATALYTLSDYVESGILTEKQKDKLIELIQIGRNILVVGSTRSGKTTFLNALLEESSKLNVRHGIIEDTPELVCKAPNTFCLLSNQYANAEELLADTLRFGPRRIIIGEARTGQVVGTMLRASNTGHEGILCSIHASSCLDGLYRIEELLEEDGATPSPRSIARAIHTVVFIEVAPDASWRKVKEIVEVKGYQNGNYQLTAI